MEKATLLTGDITKYFMAQLGFGFATGKGFCFVSANGGGSGKGFAYGDTFRDGSGFGHGVYGEQCLCGEHIGLRHGQGRGFGNCYGQFEDNGSGVGFGVKRDSPYNPGNFYGIPEFSGTGKGNPLRKVLENQGG